MTSVNIFLAATALFSFTFGLVLGLLRRARRSAADQERWIEMSSELARLRAEAARYATDRAALEAQQRSDEALRARLTQVLEEKARLCAALEADRKSSAERAADAERSRELLRAELQLLADRLLDEKGRTLLERSHEGLAALLSPVAERLRSFEAKVEKTYDQDNRDRAQLLEALRQLQETQGKLHADAESLARALTGEAKAQGDWGELILERVLEIAGLTEGHEYELQVDHRDEEGAHKRPDALVYLPGDRAVIVDAKCSLTAFVAASQATSPEGRAEARAAHVASVRAHVKSLSGKSYQDVLAQRTLDIVLMFVPNEAAFHAAIADAPALYADAFRQGVVICSPTTLLAALQLIGHLWRSERQNQNARTIAEEAGKLLEKLAAFVGDLDEVGYRLAQAQQRFDAARAKLSQGRGNLLSRAAAVARLGARVKTEKVQALLRGIDGASDGEEPLGAPPAALDEDEG